MLIPANSYQKWPLVWVVTDGLIDRWISRWKTERHCSWLLMRDIRTSCCCCWMLAPTPRYRMRMETRRYTMPLTGLILPLLRHTFDDVIVCFHHCFSLDNEALQHVYRATVVARLTYAAMQCMAWLHQGIQSSAHQFSDGPCPTPWILLLARYTNFWGTVRHCRRWFVHKSSPVPGPSAAPTTSTVFYCITTLQPQTSFPLTAVTWTSNATFRLWFSNTHVI